MDRPKTPVDKLIWATRYQLGSDDQRQDRDPLNKDCRFTGDPYKYPFEEESFWRRMKRAKACGVNTLVVAVMEGLKYPSHPEVGAPDAVEPGYLHDLLKRVRDEYGMATVPELNFSTGHGLWMGVYSRMISTPPYYRFCEDVLKDVYDVFGHPKYIHLGMDEESTDSIGGNYNVIRRGKLYWHDQQHLFDTVEKLGARAWIYADKWWWGGKEFAANVPKSVLLSNWYYASTCDEAEIRRLADKANSKQLYNQFSGYLNAFEGLEKAGYDQVPCGAYWLSRLDKAAGLKIEEAAAKNLPAVVRHCTKLCDPSRLKGFMLANWLCRHSSGDGHWDRFMAPLPIARQAYEGLS